MIAETRYTVRTALRGHDYDNVASGELASIKGFVNYNRTAPVDAIGKTAMRESLFGLRGPVSRQDPVHAPAGVPPPR